MSKRKIGNIKIKELVKYCDEHKYCSTCVFRKTLGSNDECNIGLLANFLEEKIEVE